MKCQADTQYITYAHREGRKLVVDKYRRCSCTGAYKLGGRMYCLNHYRIKLAEACRHSCKVFKTGGRNV